MSKRTGLNKSRTFRLLYTLSERGYVERTMDGQRYKLGLKLFEHATKFRRDLKRIAQPFMRQMHARFNETINLRFFTMAKSCTLNFWKAPGRSAWRR